MQHKRKQETARRQLNRLLGGVVRAKGRSKSRKKPGTQAGKGWAK